MTQRNEKHGGKRPGAGRPPKVRTAPADPLVIETAEQLLEAVVQGKVAADPARIQAAKTLIAYQRAKLRAPLRGATPRQIAERDALTSEQQLLEVWAKRAAEVRARLARERTGT